MSKKRRQQDRLGNAPNKRPKISNVTHPVLSELFQSLLPLRRFLFQRLSLMAPCPETTNAREKLRSNTEVFLDTYLVGLTTTLPQKNIKAPALQGYVASQVEVRCPDNIWYYTYKLQVVDVALRILFERAPINSRPKNMITEAHRRRRDEHLFQGGIEKHSRNCHVEKLKSPPWNGLLMIVGDGVMLELLLYTSIFVPCGNDCYYQLLGKLSPVHPTDQYWMKWQATRYRKTRLVPKEIKGRHHKIIRQDQGRDTTMETRES